MGRDWNEIFENGAEIFFDLVPPFVFQLVTLADLETSLAYADFLPTGAWLIYEFSMLASATIFGLLWPKLPNLHKLFELSWFNQLNSSASMRRDLELDSPSSHMDEGIEATRRSAASGGSCQRR